MARKKTVIADNRNHIRGIFLFFILLVLLGIVFLKQIPIFSSIGVFFGLGIFPLIFLIFNLASKNIGFEYPFNSGIAMIAQVVLIFLLASFGFVSSGNVSYVSCNLELTNIAASIESCSLDRITGTPIRDSLGKDFGTILLTFLIILITPIAFALTLKHVADFLLFILDNSWKGILILSEFAQAIYIKTYTYMIVLKNNFAEWQLSRQRSKLEYGENEASNDLDENSTKFVNERLRRKMFDDIDGDEENVEIGNHRGNSSKESNTKNAAINSRNKSVLESDGSEEDTIIEDEETESPIEKTFTMDDGEGTSYSSGEDEALVSVNGLKYPNWQLPSMRLLDPFEIQKVDKSSIKEYAVKIEDTYLSFGMRVEVVHAVIGPSVTQYQINIEKGISVRNIVNRQQDIALALGVKDVRIETIPGASLIGIEVPNKNRVTVKFSEIMDQLRKTFTNFKLGVMIGKSINNEAVLVDLQKMPHVLVAGTTGSGKSVLTNSLIMSLLMTKSPDELRLILVDPKKVEFSDYNGIPHLLTPVIIESEKVLNALKWSVEEMERRYTLLASARVRNIEGYNEKMGFSAMPYIVIVIDEVADLMSTLGKSFEAEVLRLAQKARATGIHLVLATQRPSVDVITGVLKGNIPARIALKVNSQQDSRVVMDRNGAEILLGYGDMLLGDPAKPFPQRVQGVWITQTEIQRVVDYLISQIPESSENLYLESVTAGKEQEDIDGVEIQTGIGDKDDLLTEACKLLLKTRRFSTSLLQTYMNVGYNKGARLKMQLEENGFIYPSTTKKNAYEVNFQKINEYLGGGDDSADE